jgi:hypothetical protein
MQAIKLGQGANTTAAQTSYTLSGLSARTLGGDLVVPLSFDYNAITTPPTLSGRGLTWSYVGGTYLAEGGWYAFLVFKGTGTDTGGNITVTLNGGNSSGRLVWQVSETNATLAASGVSNTAWDGTAVTVSVSTAGFTGPAVACADVRGSDGLTATPGAGWTSLGHAESGIGEGGAVTIYRATTPTTASVAWGASGGAAIVAIQGTTSSPLAAGTATLGTVSATQVTASATEATGGTAPYTKQWQRSPRSAGTWGDVTGQTTLALTDATVVSGTNYDYRLRYTDSALAVEYSNWLQADVPAPAQVVNATAVVSNPGGYMRNTDSATTEAAILDALSAADSTYVRTPLNYDGAAALVVRLASVQSADGRFLRYEYGKETDNARRVDQLVELRTPDMQTILRAWQHDNVAVRPIAVAQNISDLSVNGQHLVYFWDTVV